MKDLLATSPAEGHGGAGRRGFMLGAAGLAAGAALLGSSAPAGADTLDAYDFAPHLVWLDAGTTPYPVDLGDGGVAEADFVGEGDMAAMTFRVIVGADPDVGTDIWSIVATDFPSDFEPAPIFDPTTTPFPAAFGWAGAGMVINGTNTAGAPLVSMFQRSPGGSTTMFWGLILPTGVTGFNAGGNTPFAIEEGALMTSTLVYRRIPPS